MGVSKQAAQKRFVPREGPDPAEGFSRFTDGARQVVVAAQEAARSAGNTTIGTAHLVLALADHLDEPAAAAITGQGVSLDAVRRTARATMPAPADEVPDLIPFDGQARKVLELTFRVALRLGHADIGTADILLALLEAEDGTGVLAGLGVDRTRVEREIAG
jgi:ATP-dependent Clp protease ATP-binding subunit ClpA